MNALSMPTTRSAPPTEPDPQSGLYHVERDALYAYRAPNAPLLARCPKDERHGIRRAERDANLSLFAASPRMRDVLRRVEGQLAKTPNANKALLAEVRQTLALLPRTS